VKSTLKTNTKSRQFIPKATQTTTVYDLIDEPKQ